MATGLGQVAAKRQPQPFTVVEPAMLQATGTHDAVSFSSTPDYSHLDVPAVVRKGQRSNVTVEALANSGVDRYDIPAFLRKQAD